VGWFSMPVMRAALTGSRRHSEGTATCTGPTVVRLGPVLADRCGGAS